MYNIKAIFSDTFSKNILRSRKVSLLNKESLHILSIVVSATGRRRDINAVLSVGPRMGKFNIVSNDHGRTQK